MAEESKGDSANKSEFRWWSGEIGVNQVLEKWRIQQQQEGESISAILLYMQNIQDGVQHTMGMLSMWDAVMQKRAPGSNNGCINEHFNPQQPNDGCYDQPGDGFIVPKGLPKTNASINNCASNNTDDNNCMGNKSKTGTGKNSDSHSGLFDSGSNDDDDDDGNDNNENDDNNKSNCRQ